jgi:hypothetical protein
MSHPASPDIALVTGASKGIGRETARGLAAAGMTVLLGGRDPGRGAAAAADLAAGGGDVRFVHLDVTDPGTVKAAAAWIGDTFGRLDVLVNNGGISIENRCPVTEVTTGQMRPGWPRRCPEAEWASAGRGFTRRIPGGCVESGIGRSRHRQRADRADGPAADEKVGTEMTTQTATAPVTASTCSPEGRVTRSLLGYGPLAGTVYVGSIFIQGLTRRGFSIPHDDASLLANGPLGWIQVVTFLVAGAMTIAAAVGVRRALPSRWAPRLIGLFGAGLMAAGVFRADPADGFGPGAPVGKAAHISWHGDGHLIAASIGFIAVIAACFVVARYLSRAGHRGLGIYSQITGVAFLAAFVGVTTGSGSPAIVLPFYAAVTAVFTWLAVVCIHLYRRVA